MPKIVDGYILSQIILQNSSVQSLSRVRLSATPWIAAFMFITLIFSQWMTPFISIKFLLLSLVTIFVLVQSLSWFQLFLIPWTTAREASLSITSSRSLLKLKSIELVMSSNHLIICCSFLLLPSIFWASGSFKMSQVYILRGQSFRASPSVLPMNIQDWFPLGLTGLISLHSKGLSGVFSNTTVQMHQFFSTQLFLYPNSHVHT